jgi:hypothetical protein
MSLLPIFLNADYHYVAMPDGSKVIEMTVRVKPSELYQLFDLVVAKIESESDTLTAIRQLSHVGGEAIGGPVRF